MKPFIFQSPTRIYFGPNEETKIGQYIKDYGFESVLLVYGKSSAKKSGVYQRVIDSLMSSKIKFIELANIEPNPNIEKVLEGVELLRKNPCDLILALGGGSVIDTCKSIAHGYYYDGNPFDFNEHLVKPIKALPVGVILTIAAAGSELSTSCVIQDNARNIKRGFNSETNRPLFVIENPNLLIGLPHEQVAYGIVDILAHSMERYFSPSKEEFADYMALGLMKCVVDCANQFIKDKEMNEITRKNLMLASSFSHNGFTSIMKDITMPVHQLEHVLSGRHKEIAHGLGLAILYPYWISEMLDADEAKFALWGKVLFDVNSGQDALNAYKDLLRKLGLPNSLKSIGVKQDELESMAQSFATSCIQSIKPLDLSCARRIYVRAWKGE